MGSMIDKLMVQTLLKQVEVSRLHLSKLTEQIKVASTRREKSRLTTLYKEALKQAESMELQLALLKGKE